jgi:hypothetical protein
MLLWLLLLRWLGWLASLVNALLDILKIRIVVCLWLRSYWCWRHVKTTLGSGRTGYLRCIGLRPLHGLVLVSWGMHLMLLLELRLSKRLRSLWLICSAITYLLGTLRLWCLYSLAIGLWDWISIIGGRFLAASYSVDGALILNAAAVTKS